MIESRRWKWESREGGSENQKKVEVGMRKLEMGIIRSWNYANSEIGMRNAEVDIVNAE